MAKALQSLCQALAAVACVTKRRFGGSYIDAAAVRENTRSIAGPETNTIVEDTLLPRVLGGESQ
jgi:hypothetical protein